MYKNTYLCLGHYLNFKRLTATVITKIHPFVGGQCSTISKNFCLNCQRSTVRANSFPVNSNLNHTTQNVDLNSGVHGFEPWTNKRFYLSTVHPSEVLRLLRFLNYFNISLLVRFPQCSLNKFVFFNFSLFNLPRIKHILYAFVNGYFMLHA